MKPHYSMMAGYNAWANRPRLRGGRRPAGCALPCRSRRLLQVGPWNAQSSPGHGPHLAQAFLGGGRRSEQPRRHPVRRPRRPALRPRRRGPADRRLRGVPDGRGSRWFGELPHDHQPGHDHPASRAGPRPPVQPSDPSSRPGSRPPDGLRSRGALAGSHPVPARDRARDVVRPGRFRECRPRILHDVGPG